MEEKKKSKKKVIIIVGIVIIVVVAIIGILLLMCVRGIRQAESREFNYKELIGEAKETTNRFQIVCREDYRSDDETESKVICSIGLYADFTQVDDKNILTTMDKNGFLEYIVLDYHETDNIKVNEAKNYQVFQQPAKDYYKLTQEKNRIIVENKDTRNAGDLYYKDAGDGKYYYLGRNCASSHLICDDSPMDLTLVLTLTVKRNQDNSPNVIDIFDSIYTYACNYDFKGINKGCENTKFIDLPSATVEELKELSQTNNSTTVQPVELEKGYDLEPEKEIGIDINDEQAVLELGNRLWKYAYGTYWGNEDAWKSHESEKPNEYGVKYRVCDTTVDSIKKKYTEDATLYIHSMQSSLSVDDFIPQYEGGCQGAGRGGLQDYKTTTLKIDKIEEDVITYTAISEFCGGSFCSQTQDTVKTEENPFVIKKVNDEWLIHSYHLPN